MKTITKKIAAFATVAAICIVATARNGFMENKSSTMPPQSATKTGTFRAESDSRAASPNTTQVGKLFSDASLQIDAAAGMPGEVTHINTHLDGQQPAMVEDKANPYLLLFNPEARYETSPASRDGAFQNYVSQTTGAGTPQKISLESASEKVNGDPYYETFVSLPEQDESGEVPSEEYLTQVTSIPGIAANE